MYDFEIAIPVDTGIKKLSQRLEDFKRHGLRNVGDLKVRLVLLAAKGNDLDQIKSGWSDSLDVSVVETPYTHVAQRNYYYYSNVIEPETARWYMRIDEDTITDLGGLNANLDDFFDWQMPCHVTTILNWDVCGTDKSILRNLGYGHWYRNHVQKHMALTPPHEQETSVTSMPAISKVLEFQKAKKYFNLRKEFALGWGDHGLCHCLRMVKVHPTPIFFLSHEPDFLNLSLFGGYRNHVHWICHDKTPEFIKWLDQFNPEPYPEVAGKTFLVGPSMGQKRLIVLNEKNGIQAFYQNEDCAGEMIGLWFRKGDDIRVLFSDGDTKSGVFAKTDEGAFRMDSIEMEQFS